MKKRVVHCGTGNIGADGLRGILEHPDLELVGHYVWSADKVGKDSGELVGVAAAGVKATNDWDTLLALNADCISFFGDSIGREKQTANTICRFLERGTNAVTPSVFAWAHPTTCPPEYRDEVEAACRKGNSTAFFSGIDPGWATTDLAIAALAGANRVDCVRVMELGSMAEYTAQFVFREYFGFGKEPGFQPLLVTGGFMKEMWTPTLYAIAEVLEVELEEIKITYETDSLDHDIHVGIGEIKAGEASAVHFMLQGMSGGKPIVIVEHNDLIDMESGKQWPRPYGPKNVAYRIEIEGDPGFTIEQNFSHHDGCKICAMAVVNSISAVCESSPGLKSPLEIPRYWSRNVRSSAKRATTVRS
ncbi:diacylglycerol kinase [Sphingomonas oligophenolica]|uniref:Dihydrodipicolinate reductase n=1 Tax=Sphingomonas oligophenolica TaxID=301154 RepID=A0ABU9YCX2_9SPHN